jgi:hypothetical protein
MKPIYIGLAASLALTSLGACATAPPPRERVYVEERIVHEAPPPLRAEVIIAPPGPAERFVWDPGHWQWEAHGYRWAAGHWMPRRAGGEWIAAHWDETPGGWKFVPAHWR